MNRIAESIYKEYNRKNGWRFSLFVERGDNGSLQFLKEIPNQTHCANMPAKLS